jgi:hypothetical protein
MGPLGVPWRIFWVLIDDRGRVVGAVKLVLKGFEERGVVRAVGVHYPRTHHEGMHAFNSMPMRRGAARHVGRSG